MGLYVSQQSNIKNGVKLFITACKLVPTLWKPVWQYLIKLKSVASVVDKRWLQILCYSLHWEMESILSSWAPGGLGDLLAQWNALGVMVLGPQGCIWRPAASWNLSFGGVSCHVRSLGWSNCEEIHAGHRQGLCGERNAVWPQLTQPFSPGIRREMTQALATIYLQLHEVPAARPSSRTSQASEHNCCFKPLSCGVVITQQEIMETALTTDSTSRWMERPPMCPWK